MSYVITSDGMQIQRKATDIASVTVLGTGVLGSQIAYQSAYSGFDVTAYDISDEISRARSTASRASPPATSWRWTAPPAGVPKTR